MAQTTCGSVLRFAREKKGYGLETVARRLRIRPDILEAIETSVACRLAVIRVT